MAAPAALVAEKAAATAFANVVMGRLSRELEKKYQMWKNIERESKSLKSALVLLASAVDDQEKVARRTAVARVYCDEIRELTHDIEDCIERFLQRVTCKAGVSRARRSAHAVTTFRTRLRFAAKIKEFRNRVSEARERVLNAAVADGAQPSKEALQLKGVEYVQNFTPVGITEATQEVLALLDVEPYEDEAAEVESTPLRVVALLGFGGSGKTTLARAVHDRVWDKGKIPCAWFSGHSLDVDANGIVEHVQDEFRLRGGCAATSRAGCRDDKENRFLIVIDDIEEKHLMHYWDTLRNAFRDNGRIIVTTTNRSIANKCCNHLREEDKHTFGRVYTVRSLGEQDSRQIALLGLSPPRELVEGAKELLKKCGGLPLALSSVARQLSSEDEPTGRFCKRLGENLGMYLESQVGEPNFARLRCVLRENYTSLSDYNARNCMLYLGIFPMDHPFKKNVMIRRWLAEGYARLDQCKDKSVAEENFRSFMKRSIILPVSPVSNAVGKTCRTLSIMHVFLLHKSMHKKFIMPFGSEHKKVRHFFIHGENSAYSAGTMMIPLVDLSRVRSLTVLGNAGDAISNFNKYEITRVLDLEGCTDVNNGHLKHICKLWNLRYLSLGPNVTSIPREISQLKLLETLDVSKTSVTLLPVEAIGLPCLIHLIGKFKVEDPIITQRLPEQCMLETVSGFVADKGRGFLQLMDRMKKLNKVKISCASGQTGKDLADMNKHLCKAIREYIEPHMCNGDVRSLSLDFQGFPQGSESVLDKLCEHHSNRNGHQYHLSSLKLQGNSNPATLPEFLALFQNLTKLSLSTAMSLTRHLLSVISDMALLCSLEMIANSIDGLVIHGGNFMSLRRLCLVLKAVGPSVLTIQDGGGPEITALQLICKDLVGISGVEIKHLRKLKEIGLHFEVVEDTRQTWEAEAMKHHNRPNVLLIPGDFEEASSSQEATANTIPSEELAHEDHHTRQQEAGAVEKEPANEAHIPGKPAAVEKESRHEDHIGQEPAAVEEVGSTLCIQAEPEGNDTAPLKSGFVHHFPTSIEFHVNGAQEGGDKEALVLGAGQLRKVALR
uniref:Uncharacterized protein n=1 Tax=Avena sativa TaxID=4498 RepID=A0ACD5Y7S4_AVESA